MSKYNCLMLLTLLILLSLRGADGTRTRDPLRDRQVF